jgi:hypothetical protein
VLLRPQFWRLFPATMFASCTYRFVACFSARSKQTISRLLLLARFSAAQCFQITALAFLEILARTADTLSSICNLQLRKNIWCFKWVYLMSRKGDETRLTSTRFIPVLDLFNDMNTSWPAKRLWPHAFFTTWLQARRVSVIASLNVPVFSARTKDSKELKIRTCTTHHVRTHVLTHNPTSHVKLLERWTEEGYHTYIFMLS